MPLPHKPPTLYPGKEDLNKEWYVEFYYQVPGQAAQYKRFKERFDINRKKNTPGTFGLRPAIS